MNEPNPYRKPRRSVYFWLFIASCIGFGLGVATGASFRGKDQAVKERTSPEFFKDQAEKVMTLPEFYALPFPKSGAVRVLVEAGPTYDPSKDVISLTITGFDANLNNFGSMTFPVPKTHPDAPRLVKLINNGILHGGMTLRLSGKRVGVSTDFELERVEEFPQFSELLP